MNSTAEVVTPETIPLQGEELMELCRLLIAISVMRSMIPTIEKIALVILKPMLPFNRQEDLGSCSDATERDPEMMNKMPPQKT